MSSPLEHLRGRHGTYLIVALVGMLVYALYNPFPVDDAFISFRYAKNLASGEGLVWNPGERVEGYSNFLWTLLIALGLKFKVNPLAFSILLGALLLVASLLLTYTLALRILGDRGWALAAMLLVGLNHSVSGFTTSGMETPLQLFEFLVVGSIFAGAAERDWSWPRSVALGLMLNVALLTRPDGIVLIAAALIGWFWMNRRRAVGKLLALVAPFILIALPYLVWKGSYYGTLLPNSFNAKVHGLSGIRWGFYYLYLFTIYYLMLPFIVLVAWRGRSVVRSDRRVACLALITVTWLAYVVLVGGDFMEFRFLVPVLPFMVIIIIHTLRSFITERGLAVALTAVLFLGTANNMFQFGNTFYSYGLERLEGLKEHLYAADENWVAIGRKLGELFGGTDVTISVGASGAIPYYSGLRAIDFIGLTDPLVPKIGNPFSSMPGHRVIAPLEYLYQRGVNLIVEPINFTLSRVEFSRWLRSASWWDVYGFFFLDVDQAVCGRPIDEAILIAIPIEKGYTLVVWYLQPHPDVDRVIREQNLRRIKLVR